MSTESRYARPIEEKQWSIAGQFDTTFKWEYADVDAEALSREDERVAQEFDLRRRPAPPAVPR